MLKLRMHKTRIGVHNNGQVSLRRNNGQQSTTFTHRLLDGGSVNFHFTRKCNYACKFCFHTAKTSTVLPEPELLRVISLLAGANVRKINFAGGEPFLFERQLLAMVRHAKQLKMYTSVITNASKLSTAILAPFSGVLDMLGVSFDSALDATNMEHGRWPKGAAGPYVSTFPAAKQSLAVRNVLRAADLAHEHGFDFKVNTVVTRLNMDEDLSAVINQAAPSRWKLFQVLPLEGENLGLRALSNVTPMLIGKADVERFYERNLAGLHPSMASNIILEPTEIMQTSYILVDEKGCFLDCSKGGKTPTSSILDVGVEEAARQLLGPDGEGFNKSAFVHRNGDFYKAILPSESNSAAGSPLTKTGAGGSAHVGADRAHGDEQEVELKFRVPVGFREKCEALATPRCTQFTDTYFDDGSFKLTTRDMWLRQRGPTLELKWPATSAEPGNVSPAVNAASATPLLVDSYTESTEWARIADILRADAGVLLPALSGDTATPSALDARVLLAAGGLQPFAVITTQRTRFAVTVGGHAVHIDLDDIAFHASHRGATKHADVDVLGTYAVGEIELVKAAPGCPAAVALAEVMAVLDVPASPSSDAPVRGKVLEYLRRFDQVHWRALDACGLLVRKMGPAGAL